MLHGVMEYIFKYYHWFYLVNISADKKGNLNCLNDLFF